MKVELDLPNSNFTTKADLKNATGVDTSKLAKINNLVNLKPDVDKLDADKLKNKPTNLVNWKLKGDKWSVYKLVPALADLSKLRDVLKNDVFKKGLCNAKIKDIEEKIPNITNLVNNTTLNTKISDVKSEIPSITNLAASAALSAIINEVKNKIPNTINLATITGFTAVENKIHNHCKYILLQNSIS